MPRPKRKDEVVAGKGGANWLWQTGNPRIRFALVLGLVVVPRAARPQIRC